MLNFPCLCGRNFSLDEVQAGSQVQCPQCGRLLDVPTLEELPNITPEGTYALDIAPVEVEPGRFYELQRTFSRQKADETGEEIDLRTSVGVPEHVADGIPLAEPESPAEPAARVAPRYDPTTGELIRPLAVSGDGAAPVAAIPLATPTLTYATAGIEPRIRPARIFQELLLPHNLAVLLFLALFHVALLAILIPAAMGLLFSFPIAAILLFGVVGHYSNIIQEIGPGEMDEIPRPLRYASFGEDIWLPFVNIALAFFICFGAALAVFFGQRRGPLPVSVAILLGLAGLFFYPAALMTAATSGALANLRPDRIWGVVRKAGKNYMPAVGGFVGGLLVYFVGLYAVAVRSAYYIVHGAVAAPPGPFFIPNVFVGFFAVLAGMYLLHFSCWQLGLIWRAHHGDFPWVDQKFVRLSPRERVAAGDASRANAKQKYELRQADRRNRRGFPL